MGQDLAFEQAATGKYQSLQPKIQKRLQAIEYPVGSPGNAVSAAHLRIDGIRHRRVLRGGGRAVAIHVISSHGLAKSLLRLSVQSSGLTAPDGPPTPHARDHLAVLAAHGVAVDVMVYDPAHMAQGGKIDRAWRLSHVA